MKSTIGIAVALAILYISAAAQVTVTGAEASQVKEYASPMTIELPLAGLFGTPEGKAWVPEDLSGYVCKGVLIKKMVLKWKQREDGGITITGDLDYANTGEDDMFTTARYALHLGDKTLATDTDEDVDTEEGAIRYRRLKLVAKGAVAGEKKDAVLKIVLAVVKD